jgi:hypothetical protein
LRQRPPRISGCAGRPYCKWHALLVLAGGSYAEVAISGSKIRNHTIDPVKFNTRLIDGSDRAWAVVASNGRLIAGAGHPKVSIVGLPGQYEIDWGVPVSRRRASIVAVDELASKPTELVNGRSDLVAGFASSATCALHRRVRRTVVETFNQTGRPTPLGFDLAVIC